MKRSVKSIAMLMAVVVLAGIMSAFSLGVSAQTEPVMSIDMCNLSFRSNICVKFAVTSDSTAETIILVWDAPRTEYTYGTHSEELKTVGNSEISGNMYKIYDLTSLYAKQMTDVIYARPYTKIGDTEYYGDVVKYSILQYAYNMLGKTDTATTNENLKNLLTSMLEYGAMTQICLDYKTDRLATDDFYQVIIKGGLIDDMCAHGLYLEGDTVNISAPAVNDEDVAFTAWKNSAGETVSTSATCTITVGAKNETYEAVYTKVSQGLEFESEGDGTCWLVGMGTCEDKDLIIPATSPDGDTVIAIDSSAFANEEITSVTIPATIEEIGRKAFNGCTALTDVYYEGSSDEWEILLDSVSSGNDSLINANIHFAKITSYTVIFKDYDDRVIDTQKVAPGEAAIAPADPEREGYIFKGWDKAFDNVTSELVVTAQYEQIIGAYLSSSNQVIEKNSTLTIPVKLLNCSTPIKTMGISIVSNVPEGFTIKSGSWSSDFDYELQNFNKTRLQGASTLVEQEIVNGDIFEFEFTTLDTLAAGTYTIEIEMILKYFDDNEDEVSLPCQPAIVQVTVR